MTDVAPTPDRLRIIAPADAAGQRADRFLADAIGTMSRSRVKGLIEQGRVSRDGVPFAQPAEAVRAGALYELQPLPLVSAVPQPQDISFTILFEDSDLLVLDKPAGLVVHPAPGHEDGTLVNALLAHCGDSLPGIGGERRPGIVHRLDRDTTGVMVVAKTEQALATLSAMFAARDLDRAYLALVWGVPSPAAGEIEGAIGRDPRDRKRMAIVASGGRAALTRYQVEQVFSASTSLVRLQLATGRTHQIRVHLSSRGHPVVGDPLYLRRVPAASRGMDEPARTRLLDFPRQALHAATLGFRHPRTGSALFFETPLPADFRSLLDSLGSG
jgi:23S rRNA pseudouridine1911/1915/1917 synthase